MTQLWLMLMVALLAVNVIAQDRVDSDEPDFLNLVRKTAFAGRSDGEDNARQTETDLSEEHGKRPDDSFHEAGDDNLDEQDTSSMDIRKRTRNSPEYSKKQQALNQPMRATAAKLRQLSTNKDDRVAVEQKKRCASWSCKKRFLIPREKVLSKKSQVTDSKRCMSWGCRKRSLKFSKRDSTTTRNSDDLKGGNLERQEQSDLKKKASQCIAWNCNEGKRTAIMKGSGEIDASKRVISRKPDDVLGMFGSSRDGKCRGLECLTKRMREQRNADASKRIISRKPDDVLGMLDSSRDGKCTGLECLTKRMKEQRNADDASMSRKDEMPPGCLTWECYGKRTAIMKGSGEIDTSKRIISRKPDDVLGMFGSSRNGKCTGLECLTKRMREQRNADASKRVISRKPDDVLGMFDSSRNGKCRGLECLTKRMREQRNADASLSRKDEMPSGCMTWDCYGKRKAAKGEPAAIDPFKRIISMKNDKDLNSLGLSNEKCRGWECLKKRVMHRVQDDIPIMCLSWDCDKRRADTGESTKIQENIKEQSHEKDESQYGIPDEYKDMIQRPIKRDVLGRISPYFTDRGSRRTLQKEDIQEK